MKLHGIRPVLWVVGCGSPGSQSARQVWAGPSQFLFYYNCPLLLRSSQAGGLAPRLRKGLWVRSVGRRWGGAVCGVGAWYMGRGAAAGNDQFGSFLLSLLVRCFCEFASGKKWLMQVGWLTFGLWRSLWGHVRWWTIHLPAGDQNKTPVVMSECFFTSNIFLFEKLMHWVTIVTSKIYKI